ncbi:NAD(P)/FAD-dependent oxidoreductase [Parasediminibacterium paludis]|uniref:NAD(P)/FAD-dependent oxidoreductase n=1 Tax=Parasediminibacterium paludis TaxID=908966 RepID=A0ABV8PR31_9BACT
MDSITKYDVAIIGGGLAGLTLAIQCARAGFITALYEKEHYPFHRVCGEYISLESKDFLKNMGVDIEALQLPIINTLHITDSYGHLYHFTLPLGGFGISRFMLDDILYQQAQQAGVHIFTATKVQNVVFNNQQFAISTSHHQHKATVAVGSFGKRSNLDVKLQRPFINQNKGRLHNYIGIKYHIKHAHPVDTIALHNFKNGYCGISKIEGDTYCLCYLTTADNLKANDGSIKQMEATVLQKNPKLKDILTQAEFLYEAPLAISQISFSPKATVENHMLMVGDAAGLITPLCGNGMSMALHGSKLAFTQIQAYLQKDISRKDMEENFTNEWKAHFGKRLWIGRMVQRLFGGNYVTYLFLKTMQQSKWLSTKLIKATHGQPF